VSRAPTSFAGADVVPLSGGYSGETFLVTTGGEQAVLRLYARDPGRAAVDRALLERLRGLVPVPAVLESSLVPAADGPPFLLLEALPGDRLDVVLPAADESLRRRLGEAVTGMLVLLATERMPRAGWFADASLDVQPFPAEAADPVRWLTAQLTLPWYAGLTRDERAGLRSVATRARELTSSPARLALVHGDFNPKNLLVDPATGGVTGVLDWEYAYAGAPLGDVGNLLRFETDEDFVTAVGSAYVDRAPDVPDNWVEVARALDLFALFDLAGREAPGNPVVAGAREILLETARTGDLAAGRPDPG
jgi:aminoglycoside phosphotransferase (APT) family kinase protein